MFHITISAMKYLCAKYTYFFLHREEKDSEDTPHPRRPQTPHLWKKGKSTQAKQSRRRKTWWKLSPQQVIVMFWIQGISAWKVHRS
ncbi:hypothetical protein AB205_0143110 [Aquarana catesbeiana]|uniref:Uncharacterized protein n=1 Tax=Aquarana catesbeiana TaxID=8400 RepID=A0A2G9RCR7_AQUCT|nr:hypothetical protein AB205_0143110 [Aquarana catesbeiana]